MNKEQAIKIMQNLNKVINGSDTIINAIQNNKNINPEKAIKACCKSNIVIAQELKNVIQSLIKDTPSSTNDNFNNVFSDIFKGS